MDDEEARRRWDHEQKRSVAEKFFDDEKEYRLATAKAATDSGVHALKAGCSLTVLLP
ncbi:hypothetical protein K1718_10385 [Roseibium porphyridii]|uniref:Uncharacterized protein n=1 Tax=Roseibium porphyridii TaxID=2866279 RepID=A0ABY8FC33_9HYPH|nr:hypothetical protein [Roseibium sp. KMA01]WFE91742.1 hypothetical protein K1718_10385 [Roseibium sp. KMA01]